MATTVVCSHSGYGCVVTLKWGLCHMSMDKFVGSVRPNAGGVILHSDLSGGGCEIFLDSHITEYRVICAAHVNLI